jgi:hypothetical protein
MRGTRPPVCLLIRLSCETIDKIFEMVFCCARRTTARNGKPAEKIGYRFIAG